MKLHLEQDRFITDISNLIKKAAEVSLEDQMDLEYYRVGICRYYNQASDWDENPELAEANFHHPQEALQITVVMMLMHLGLYASRYDETFVAGSYLTLIE